MKNESDCSVRHQLSRCTAIVTHGGTFHADEVLSIALLRTVGCDAPILRTNRVESWQLDDPQVLVLDMGLQYEPVRGNFDHHQSFDLLATNRLVLDYFGTPLLGKPITDLLQDRLFTRVSDIDRGAVVLTDTDGQEFNSLIRAFNAQPEGFDKALLTSELLLAAQIAQLEQYITDCKRWRSLHKHQGIAYLMDGPELIGWKAKARQDSIYFLLMPSSREPGCYALRVRDTAELRIPAHPDQRFLHASGFMATYSSLAAAQAHAHELLAGVGA